MHTHFLKKALALAAEWRGFCSPNPSVGAILVHNDTIIAQASHQGVGQYHAEYEVLCQLDNLCRNRQFDPLEKDKLTLYVTLEPCNHWGNTPPCVEAIVSSGIKKVVFAYYDPNPVVKRNNSQKLLAARGVVAEYFPVDAIDVFYASYRHWINSSLPWVTAKLALSIDGKIGAKSGAPIRITGRQLRQFTHESRRQSDVILTSAKTILCDDPRLNVRLNEVNTGKPIAIIDKDMRLSATAKIWQSSSRLLIFTAKENEQLWQHEKAEYFGIDELHGRLNLEQVIRHLGKLGFHDVWVEAGARLFNALHKFKLVNRSYLYLAPKFIGSTGMSADLSDVFMAWTDIQWKQMGADVMASIDWEVT